MHTCLPQAHSIRDRSTWSQTTARVLQNLLSPAGMVKEAVRFWRDAPSSWQLELVGLQERIRGLAGMSPTQYAQELKRIKRIIKGSTSWEFCYGVALFIREQTARLEQSSQLSRALGEKREILKTHKVVLVRGIQEEVLPVTNPLASSGGSSRGGQGSLSVASFAASFYAAKQGVSQRAVTLRGGGRRLPGGSRRSVVSGA